MTFREFCEGKVRLSPAMFAKPPMFGGTGLLDKPEPRQPRLDQLKPTAVARVESPQEPSPEQDIQTFGRSQKQQVPLGASVRNQSREERLQWGWDQESRIRSALDKQVGPMQEPVGGASSDVDRYQKIDGFLTSRKSGETVSVQIKARQSGDDIIFELYKDLDRGVKGRDWVSKAQMYAVLDSGGSTLHLVDTGDVKRKAESLMKTWEAKGKPREIFTSIGDLKVQAGDDPYSSKLMAYIFPNAVSGMSGFPKSIRL